MLGDLILPSWLRPVLYGAVLMLGVVGGILWYGEHQYHLGQDNIKALIQVSTARVQQGSAKVTERIVTEYIPQVQYIEGKTKILTKEVTKYVTQKDDSGCAIPASFVWLWNQSNQMQLPDYTQPIPGGASEVVLSEVEAQHTFESGICLANEARIIAMSDWLKQQKALYDRQ